MSERKYINEDIFCKFIIGLMKFLFFFIVEFDKLSTESYKIWNI